METLQKYSRFIKFEHTLFSLPLLFAGALLAADGWPGFRETALIILAGGAARVVAMSLNRIFDRSIDRLNPRTRDRHLSAGTMNLWEAWGITLVFLATYLLAAWMLSDFCLRWAWLPLAGFTAYPLFKRFTKWTHVGLGIVWGMVPLAGAFAVKPGWEGTFPVFLLSAFCVFWLAGFDIIYATQDEDFDRAHGVHSLPGAWGAERALRLSAVFHAAAFAFLLLIYIGWLSGPLTLLLLIGCGALLWLEQALAARVDLAFFKINAALGFVVLFFILTGIKGV